MESKQENPPSYETAIGYPPPHFAPGQPMPMPLPHQPVGFQSSPYPTGNGPAPGFVPPPAVGFHTLPYPTGNGPAPGFILPPAGDFKSSAPYPDTEGASPSGYTHSQAPHAVTQVTVIQQAVNYGDKSQPVTCPHCRHDVLTRIEAEPSTQTHLCALLMCAFGIWPCCCLPYCIDSCQKINHYCPNCGVYLGSYQN